MFKHNNYSKKFVKKSSKLLNNISLQNNRNIFLLDNLISNLYSHLCSLVPEKIAFSAAINSKDTFEYFLEYSVEKTKLVLNRNNNVWSLCYKVYPSYLYDQQKFKDNTNISHVDRIVVHLNDFFTENVKKYYH
jgi:predicted PolB exonuclease-like 3'-5' exonuclease